VKPHRKGKDQLDFIRAERFYGNYNRLIAPLLPALAAYTVYRRYGQKKSAASFKGQWGGVPAEVEKQLDAGAPGAPRIWLHAVSVGEQIAARPVLRALRQELPDARIALSVTTDTGYQTAEAAVKASEADALFYFPLDTPVTVKRVLKVIRPDAFLIMETELWPNVLHLCKASGASTFLVNGRVSDNLLKRARKMGWVWRWMLLSLDGLLMRSAFDAERMKRLGAKPGQLHTTGDVKLDAVSPGDAADKAAISARWRETLKIDNEALVWVAGSTHPGEEEPLLESYIALKQEFPQLRLILAPRHIERAEDVAQIVRSHNLPVARRSTIDAADAADVVILLDTVGELSQVFAAADIAFVGGSLIPRGGHNVLEPVLRGVPVAYGPHVANFREAAALVEGAGVGKRVENADELTAVLRLWLASEPERQAVAQRSAEALVEHQGAAGRVARIVGEAVREKKACSE
jgi:3-deoxy-D-manno-octulosonic-acid transferase